MTQMTLARVSAPSASTTTSSSRPRARAPRRAGLALGALAAWCALYVIARWWGLDLLASGIHLQLGDSPPLVGNARSLAFTARLLPALLLGVAVVITGPSLARRASWPAVLGGSVVMAGTWSVAVAFVARGGDVLTAPLRSDQYLATVDRIGDPIVFLSGFVERIATYNIHTQGHPPGFVLGLWGLDRLGLGGAGWAAFLCIGGGAAAVAAALVALRDVAGEDAARRAAPFVAVAPVAVFVATTGDGFFAGLSAWAVAFVVLATGRTDRRGDALALAGGLLFGMTAFLSYGLVLLALVPLTVAGYRRSWRSIALAALGAVPVFLIFSAAGFSWLDGLAATRDRYFAGVASRRPYGYFLLADVAALALALGPAAAVALAWLRDRRVWVLVGAALAVVALADVSGMSKAEVERIWVPFTPWVLLASAALGARVGPASGGVAEGVSGGVAEGVSGGVARARGASGVLATLLAAQVATTLWIQLAWATPW